MDDKNIEISRIVNAVKANDPAGRRLWEHMVECGWAWCEVSDDHPDLTAEEIASAAACGFEVAP